MGNDDIRLRLSTKRILYLLSGIHTAGISLAFQMSFLSGVGGSGDIEHLRALQRVRHANAFDKHGSQSNVSNTWLEWPFRGHLSLCQQRRLSSQHL